MAKNKFISGPGHVFNPVPRNKEEAVAYGNALAASGNYPVGTSSCFNVGISGGCGPECFVYLEGACEVAEEMVDALNAGKYPKFSLEEHYEIYDQDGNSR